MAASSTIKVIAILDFGKMIKTMAMACYLIRRVIVKKVFGREVGSRGNRS